MVACVLVVTSGFSSDLDDFGLLTSGYPTLCFVGPKHFRVPDKNLQVFFMSTMVVGSTVCVMLSQFP